MSLTSWPSARPLVRGLSAPMTRPRSPGDAAPVSAIAARTSRLDLGLGQLLGQELGEDGGLRLLGRGAVLAARRRGTS